MNRNQYGQDERMRHGIGRERELERQRNQQFQGQYSRSQRQDLESGSLGSGAHVQHWSDSGYPGQRDSLGQEYGQEGQQGPPVHSGQYEQQALHGQENFRGRGPKGYVRPDERIKEEICERLTRHPDIDASDIEIAVRQGVITLTGSVDHRPAKHLVEDLVDRVSGVKDIENRLSVKTRSQPMESKPRH